MTIIEPRFQILSPQDDLAGVVALRTIERAARISHRSEDKQTDDSWQRFIQFVVMEKGDWSVTEHVSATVVFRVDRGVTHELVRHRLFSFTQESTRFVNYNKRAMDCTAEEIKNEVCARWGLSAPQWLTTWAQRHAIKAQPTWAGATRCGRHR